jgi:hypothetical protein
MRSVELPQKIDVLVSELLGSFGDNELSPECLDGAMRFMKREHPSLDFRVSHKPLIVVILSERDLHTVFIYRLSGPAILI